MFQNCKFTDDAGQSNQPNTPNAYMVVANRQIVSILLQDTTCNNVAGIISRGFPYWTLFDRQTSVGPINITDDDGILAGVIETILLSSEDEIILFSLIIEATNLIS